MGWLKAPGTKQASVGELVNQLSHEVTNLFKAEVALAKLELTAKVKRFATAIGLIGFGAVLAFWATGVLIAAAIAGIATELPIWLAALIVGVALLAITAGLILVAKNMIAKATKMPFETPKSVKADIAAVREGKESTRWADAQEGFAIVPAPTMGAMVPPGVGSLPRTVGVPSTTARVTEVSPPRVTSVTPVASVPVASAPVARGPVASVPVASLPVVEVPVAAVPAPSPPPATPPVAVAVVAEPAVDEVEVIQP